MKTFKKIYIAKGKQIQDMKIIRVSLNVEDILKHAHDYKGEKLFTFEVARMKGPDKFGNQYTVYVNKLVEEDENQPQAAPQESAKEAKTSKKTGRRLVSVKENMF